MIQVKWVTQDELDRNKHDLSQWNGEPRMIPVIPLAALTEVVEGLREFHDFFTSNHENVGLELYGRVNGKELTPTAQRLNELLDQTKRLLAQLAPEKEGSPSTIEGQAQEIAESERKLRELCMAHGPALIEIHDLKQTIAQQAQEIERLERSCQERLAKGIQLDEQLAAMTTERDQQGRYACEMLDECKRAQIAEQQALKQLATAQARVKELEEKSKHDDQLIYKETEHTYQLQARVRELLGGMCLALEQEIDRTSRNEAGRGPTNYREYIEAKQALRETAKNDGGQDEKSAGDHGMCAAG